MNFINRLQVLMREYNDDVSGLAKRAGIPYPEAVALFNRSWEKTPVWVMCAVCEAYNVSLDYMVYGKKDRSAELRQKISEIVKQMQ